MNLLKKIFKSSNDRALSRLDPLVNAVMSLESKIAQLSDTELQAKTDEFRNRLAQGQTLDDIQVEAFAVAREASWRILGMKPYEVQVRGGFVLHQGNIAEMKTGEGKTLVATMPTYLNALTGKGVHVVTVNDYLARRDAEWMGQLYRWLGLSTGVIINGLNDEQRKEAYLSDITYGQNNEFGFDYLRDNMKFRLEDYVQRELNFAIIDEVDSILIDEARTPLIISGQAENANELYVTIDKIIPKLKKDLDFNVDEKSHSATLTDTGVDRVEALLGIEQLYDPSNIIILHHVNNALKAHTLYKRDVNYLVQGGEVIIIDEHTGRLMDGRRWSDGLHQAVEAKEGADIQAENQTLATISFQNYFRIYNKLSGMTGTAKTEEEEFQNIYKLNVLVVPTNKVIQRHDLPDKIYRTERGKFTACIERIKQCAQIGQPVLVGTTSVEKSEIIHRLLQKEGIAHEVLNAKHHSREASIVAQAGRFGRITVATNMAGRGTDIILGGNSEYWGQSLLEDQGIAIRYTDEWEIVEDFVKMICIFREDEAKQMRDKYDLLSEVSDETIVAISETRDEFKKEQAQVLEVGGLFILGTERHESRRIDNQLRGRAGRQGDPGVSRFYLSLEDDLMRIFAKDMVVNMMDKMGMDDHTPIESRLVSNSVETAQRRIEGQNFDHRKHLLEYDDVMNQQRKSIYSFRLDVLKADADQMHEICLDSLEDLVRNQMDSHCNSNVGADQWNVEGIQDSVYEIFGIQIDLSDLNRNRDHYTRRIYFALQEIFKEKSKDFDEVSEGTMSNIAKQLFLQVIDELWKRHLQTMDQFRSGIGLRGYGQKDPKKEYQREGFQLFTVLLTDIRMHVMNHLFFVEMKSEADLQAEQKAYEEYVHQQEEERRLQQEYERRLQEHESNQAQRNQQARRQSQRKRLKKQAKVRKALTSSSSEDPQDVSTDDIDLLEKEVPTRREHPRLGRNDPCYCGSGKKYKKCCLLKDSSK
jgi:preprotein translocase subunit SecA